MFTAALFLKAGRIEPPPGGENKEEGQRPGNERTTMDKALMQKYADFVVKVGVNVQPRQTFLIRCPVDMAFFAHACAKAGYEAGAKEVIVRYEDEQLARLKYEMADEETLKKVHDYELRSWEAKASFSRSRSTARSSSVFPASFSFNSSIESKSLAYIS